MEKTFIYFKLGYSNTFGISTTFVTIDTFAFVIILSNMKRVTQQLIDTKVKNII